MDNLNFKKIDLGNHKEMADELEKLQENENNGSGISCVKQIVACLRMGEIAKAKIICKTNRDEIKDYPVIKDFLIKNLFKEEDNPFNSDK